MGTLHESAYEVCQEAMALLREEQTLNKDCILYGQSPKEGTATKTPNKVEYACRTAYENARHDILDSFNWSFCKRDVYTKSSQDGHGRFTTAYPGVAEIKVISCYGEDGDRVEWTVRGRESIVSNAPIDRIVYIEDLDDVTEWPRLVRTALVYKLASMLAIEITGRAADMKTMDAAAQRMVAQARTDDARQCGTGTSAYGRNYLYDIATGRRQPKFVTRYTRW